MAADDGSVAGLIAALREDPVRVDQILGNGVTAEVHDRLGDLAQQVGSPAYVALVAPIDGLANGEESDDLLRQLHQGLGDGYYVVGVADSIVEVGAYGTPVDGASAANAAYDAEQLGRAQLSDPVELAMAGEAAVALTVLGDANRELDQQQLTAITSDPLWVRSTAGEPEDPDDGSFVGAPLSSLVVAVACGATALVLGWRLLRAWAAPAPSPSKRQASGRAVSARSARADTEARELTDLRGQAEREVAALERDLGRSRTRTLEELDAAQACRDRAGELLTTDQRPGRRPERSDPARLDLIGALVLARTGRAALQGSTYHCCFFDPRHGAATTTGNAATSRGGGPVSVPCCRRCASALRDERSPEPLEDGEQPYYEGDSVWAATGFGSLVDDLWRRVGSSR